MPPLPPRRPFSRLATLQKSVFSRQPPKQATTIKTPCCEDPKIEDNEGGKVCKHCYTQISESNIVADVTFVEDARGAATVQGGYISENARHARTLGSAAYRRVGGGEKNSIQEIEANGRRELASLCPRLSIPETISTQAASIWSLAAKQNFTAGRRTDEVIAACLYAACRRQKENTILLMDISEQQKINVFRLGEVYKDLRKELFLDSGNELGFQRLVEIEPLILKYCRNLEFGDKTRQVAEDAVKIIRRMKRDWITTGRHPAGLCGGAIILAARMNNFRRTVREIVYVSKVADITVAKRVEEFRRTKSAALTVDQFREYGPLLKEQADPPSFISYKDQQFEKKKRKRQAYHARREGTGESHGTVLSSAASTPAPDEGLDEPEEEAPDPKRARTESSERRYDADGFAIPPLPVNLSALPELEPTGTPLRKKKDKPAPVLQISPEELEQEKELEQEIEEVLEDPKVLDTRNDIERAKGEERARLLAEQQKQLDAEKIQARRNAQGITWFNGLDPPSDELITAEDLEAEFADDPEVMNCKLSDEEVRLKEKIWVAFNEDWLRTQHEKELMAKINESTGRTDYKKKAQNKRKKRGKMGDGTLLAEAGTPIETPGDANAAMLAKRAPVNFSRYVNYEALSKVYGHMSRATSEAPSISQASAYSRDETPATERSFSPTPDRAPATPASSRRPKQPVRRSQNVRQPPSPPATQAQPQTDHAEQHEDADEEPDVDDRDYDNDEYNEDHFGGEDDREDIGEEHYNHALNEFNQASLEGTFDDEY